MKTGLIIMFRCHQQPTHGKICRNIGKPGWTGNWLEHHLRLAVGFLSVSPGMVGGGLGDSRRILVGYLNTGYDPAQRGFNCSMNLGLWDGRCIIVQGMWSAGQLFDNATGSQFRLSSSGFQGLLLRGQMCPLN